MKKAIIFAKKDFFFLLVYISGMAYFTFHTSYLSEEFSLLIIFICFMFTTFQPYSWILQSEQKYWTCDTFILIKGLSRKKIENIINKYESQVRIKPQKYQVDSRLKDME